MKLPSEITKLTDFDIYIPVKIGILDFSNGWTYYVDHDGGHYRYERN